MGHRAAARDHGGVHAGILPARQHLSRRRTLRSLRVCRPRALVLLPEQRQLRDDEPHQYRNIVTKTYFPREIIPLAQVSSRLLDFGAAASLYAVLMIYYGVGVTRWALLVPVLCLPLLAFTVGVTLLTSAVNVFYRDVNPVVQIGLQLWLYATPIAYPLAKVPPQWRGWIALNPLTGIVEGFRSAVVYGREPDWALLALSASLSAITLVAAFVLFKRLDRYFADVI